MKKSVLGLALVIGALASLVFGVGGAQAAVTPRYVSTSGSDAGDCSVQATPCKTIAYAVGQAVAGDTVSVGAGSYDEMVTINKSLTLLGAQAGVDARNRNANGSADSGETIVTSASGPTFKLTSGSSTVDGFKLENTATSAGIFVEGGTNDVIRNDIFSGAKEKYAVNGIFNGATFRHNRVEGLEIGFESDLAPGPNTTVDANKFVGDTEYDIGFIEGGTGDVVSGNERTGGSANFVALFKTSGAEVTGNVVTGISSSVVYVGGATEGTSISGNTFNADTSSGVSIANDFAFGPNRSPEISANTLTDTKRGVRIEAAAAAGVVEIHSNRISGNSEAGVLNEGQDAVDATGNWWGCNAGPNATGCDKATGPVESGKWLVLSLVASPSPIYAGTGSAQLTATLTRDSAGEVVGSVPASTPVSFATTLGTTSGAASTEAGQATAQLTAPSTTGTADVTATLDGETVHAPVQIVEAPAGQNGQNGSQGSQGAQGDQGQAGSNGSAGSKGENGSNGSKGETGAAGEKGETGSSGGSVALKRKVSLKFVSGTAVVSGGDAAVKVRCLGSTAKNCVGTLTLKVGGQTAKAAYSVAVGKTATIKVALGDGATTRAAGGAVKAAAKTLQPTGGAVTTKRTLHLS